MAATEPTGTRNATPGVTLRQARPTPTRSPSRAARCRPKLAQLLAELREFTDIIRDIKAVGGEMAEGLFCR